MKSYFYIFIMILSAYSIQTNAQKIIINTNFGTTIVYNLKTVGSIDFTNNNLTVTLNGGAVEQYSMDSLSSYLYDVVNNTVSTKILEALPIEYLNSFPNPNSGTFNINYTLKKSSDVSVRVFDLNGVAVYVDNFSRGSGQHSDLIDLKKDDVNNGIYIIELSTPNERFIDKIVLNK